jgi:gas vesicle protein
LGLFAALGIGAAVGGLFGLFSTDKQSREAQAQLEQQKKTAWAQYPAGQKYSDQQFSLQRREAQSQLYAQENRLNQSVDQEVAQFNTGLRAQAYGIQDAQIQAAGDIGASLAAEAAGGTRGSTGGGLMRSYAQQSLDRNIALQNRQNDQALAGMLSQANNSLQDINRERASWQAGGYAYESQVAQDSYNRELAKLGQADFDWRINAAAAAPEDYLLGMFGGASSGLALGSSVYGYSQMAGQEQPQGFNAIGYGEAGRGYTNNGMSTDWRIR